MIFCDDYYFIINVNIFNVYEGNYGIGSGIFIVLWLFC